LRSNADEEESPMRFPIIVGFACAALLSGAAAAQTAPAAAPADDAAPAEAAAPKPKPRGPQPASVVTVSNATASTAMTVTVTGEGKTAKLSKPLAPKARASLRLPKTPALPRLGRGDF
jgi:hypothetical protein